MLRITYQLKLDVLTLMSVPVMDNLGEDGQLTRYTGAGDLPSSESMALDFAQISENIKTPHDDLPESLAIEFETQLQQDERYHDFVSMMISQTDGTPLPWIHETR